MIILVLLLKAKLNEIKVAVAADILSLVKLTPPEKWRRCCAGTTQRFRFQ
jgi:glycine dehydrogenase